MATVAETFEHELSVLRVKEGDLVLVYFKGEYPRAAGHMLAEIMVRMHATALWVPEGFHLERLSRDNARALYRSLRDLYGRESGERGQGEGSSPCG